MSLYYSIKPVNDDGRTYVADSPPYYSITSSDLVTKVSNWQAAFIEAESANKDLEFHVTGAAVTGTGSLGNAANTPVLNGLQVVPVIEFIQPGVNSDNEPMEYGPLEPGDYLLMHVHGGVNVAGSQPKYAGGFYRFVYSTEQNPEGPQIVRLHHPEIGRYNTGAEVVEAYSGKQYTFNHTGGYIQFSFDDISEHYGDNHVTTGLYTGPYVQHGLTYTGSNLTDPIAPIFALVNMAALNYQDGVVNPPLFNPSFGLIPSSGEEVIIYSTTTGASIYYTKTIAPEGTEPLDPPVPTFDSSGNPTGTTTLYTVSIPITEATKFKAIARKSGLPDSPLTSIYYFGKKKVTLIDDTSTLDDNPADDLVAPVVFTPGSNILPIVDAVHLTSATPLATIYFTVSTALDVNQDVIEPADPTTASAIYSGPFVVNMPTKFKAFAVKAGLISSVITGASYTQYIDFLSPVIFDPTSAEFTTAQFGAGFPCTIVLGV